MKYYFMDMGLRNARINFRQIEVPHSMENVITSNTPKPFYNDDSILMMNVYDFAWHSRPSPFPKLRRRYPFHFFKYLNEINGIRESGLPVSAF